MFFIEHYNIADLYHIYSVCPVNYNKTGTNDLPKISKSETIRANIGNSEHFPNLDN